MINNIIENEEYKELVEKQIKEKNEKIQKVTIT